MGQISKAVRDGKRIVISYDIPSREKGDTIAVCIVNRKGELASKPVKTYGRSIKTTFKFGEAAETASYVKAYLDNHDKKQQSDTVPIVKQSKILPALLATGKYIAVPLSLLLVMILLFRSCFSASVPLESWEIKDAFFEDHNTIVAEGHIEFRADFPDARRKMMLRAIRAGLLVDGELQLQQALTAADFRITFGYPIKKLDRRYEIKIWHPDGLLKEQLRQVRRHHDFPVGRIDSAYFMANRRLQVGLTISYAPSPLNLQVYSLLASGGGGVVAEKKISATGKYSVQLGPLHQYAQKFVVILAPVANLQRITDKKVLPYPFAEGKLSAARYERLDTFIVEGSWSGPPGATINLEIVEKKSDNLIHQTKVDRLFHKKLKAPKLSDNYLARLKQGDAVIAKRALEIPQILQDYLAVIPQMPKLAMQFDDALDLLIQATDLSTNQVAIAKIRSITAICQKYERVCDVLGRTLIQDQRLDRIRKFYDTLANLCRLLAAHNDTVPAERKSKTIAEFIAKYSEKLPGMIAVINNLATEVQKTDNELLTNLTQSIERERRDKRIEELLGYIHSYVVSDQWQLALDICSDSWKKYPETWQFLLARYQLYRHIQQKNEHSSVGRQYQNKADQDRDRLADILRTKFRELRRKGKPAQAYVIGLQLLQLQPDLRSIKLEVDFLQQTVPLEERVKASLEIPQIEFPSSREPRKY